MGMAYGYHTGPTTDAMQRIPPIIGGDQQSEIGGSVWVLCCPHHLCYKRGKPPSLGGVKWNEIGAVWYPSQHPIIVDRESPQMMGQIKELEWSSVWAAHCSFASGRQNKMVYGLHTASFASGRPNKMVSGLHTTSFVSRRPNEMACGMHTALLSWEMILQEGGGHKHPPPHLQFPFSPSFPSSFTFLLLFLSFLLPQSSWRWRAWSLLWGEKGSCEQVWNKPKPTNTNTKSNTNQKHKSHVL